jgi:HEAT repeat protein
VRADLERRVPRPPASPDAAVLLAKLRVLAVIGTRADLPRLPALAPRENDDMGPSVAEALRGTYAAILRRDPAVLADGLRLLRSCDPSAGKQLLFALGDLGDKRALPLLDVCIRSIPTLSQQAAAIVPLVGSSGDPDLDQPLAAFLGEGLDPERPEWTRAALLAIGVLDNGSQVPVLLQAMESEHPGLHQAALGALRQISGLAMGDSSAAWREWYARETQWQESGRQRARSALALGADVLVAQALDAYADHRLFREERVEDVLGVLEHGSPAMRVMACDTLARIGSRSALPRLIELISDEHAALADAAWRASCALTGQTLPRTALEAREQTGGI